MGSSRKVKEFDGITVDDAIRKAEQVMSVSRENLTIKVVCEERKGLFGMQGANPAKIKVFLKEPKSK